MANFQSDYAKGLRPMPVAQGAELLAVKLEVPVTAALALNDILEFGELPEDHVPEDFQLVSTDIDTGGSPAVAMSVGLLNAGKTDVSTDAADGGAVWLATSNVGQAGTMARPTGVAHTKVAPSSTTRRMVGAKITTAGATPAAGTVTLLLRYRAASYGA